MRYFEGLDGVDFELGGDEVGNWAWSGRIDDFYRF